MAYMVAQASERAIDVATCPVCTTPCATCKPESCSCACLFRVKRRSMGHSCVPHIQHIHVSKSCAANKDVAVICQPSFTHTSLSHVHPASPYRRWLRINEQTCSSGTVSFQYLLQCMSSPEPAGHNMLARPTRIGRWEIAILGCFQPISVLLDGNVVPCGACWAMCRPTRVGRGRWTDGVGANPESSFLQEFLTDFEISE